MLKTSQIVRNAWSAGLVVPAFNVPCLPMVEPVIRAVRDADAFALVETSRLEWVKFEAGGVGPVKEEFDKHDDPEHVRLHLDHVPVIDEDGNHVDVVPIFKEALALGYLSVMIDGSRLSLDENIRATAEATKLAHDAGAACEAELGAVLGHEAGPFLFYDELFESGKGFTDVQEARRFVTETNVDWLSVAVGSVHGAVTEAKRDEKKVAARINIDHVRALKEATGVPLVLHGGSGVQRDYVLDAIKNGIAKVNVGTEIRQAYDAGFKTNGVAGGVEATYERTKSILVDYFGLTGTRREVMGE